MRKLFLALALVCVAAFGLSAQEGEWYDGKPIKDIQFTGLDRVSVGELEGVIKPFLNKPLTAQIVDELQRRLYDMENFDSVIPDFQAADASNSAVIIVFDVIERPVIDEITIKGNDTQRTSDLLAEIVLKSGKPVIRPKIVQDEENLRKFYIKNGYADVLVESTVEPGRKSTNRKLVFTIVEGNRTSVRKVVFSGNKFASESTLKGLLKSAEQSLFNAGTFQEANLDLDRQAIVKYYRDNGYIDAKVVDITRNSEFSQFDKRNYLTIGFYVEEGEQWTFGGVSVTGSEIFPEERLLGMVTSKTGAVLNMSRLQADYQSIADLYYQNGYINNGISLDLERDEATRILAAVIKIEEKGRAYIENIIIRGAKKTDIAVILRALPFETGDVFSSARIREGLLALTNLRYFSNVVPETPAGSVPGLYDLVLNMTEQNTIDLRLGFSLTGSTDVPIAAFIRFADTNFLGKGVELAGELNISASEQKITASFSDPWLLGPNWGAGISLSVDHSFKTGVPVDMSGPIFTGTESYPVPDPFDGHFVFSTQAGVDKYKTDNGISYAVGAAFPGVPNETQISTYDLKTDYAYAGGSSEIDDAYTMKYDNWDISLGLNTGKRERTAIGWFSWGVSGNVGLNYIDYDQTKYRPFESVIRDNYKKFLFINSLGAKLALDNRDITFDPGNGYYISQGATLVGGLLGGTRHYIQTSSNIQAYLTLWDVPVSEVWSWKTVVAFNTSLDVLFPEFFTYDHGTDTTKNFIAADRLLYTNQMTVARGWPSVGNGEALWNSWLEIRTPIVPQLLSLDGYFEAVHLTQSRLDIFKFDQGVTQSPWMFGFGIGLRLLNPSLPLRLYVGKRFSFDAGGNVQWQKGNLGADTNPGSGVDLIFAFSLTN